MVNTGIVSYTLEGNPWSGNDITNWGSVYPGETQEVLDFNVNNQRNSPITPILLVTAPSGWIVTWSLNNTVIPAHSTASGSLSLWVPSDALAGPVSIPCNIDPAPNT